MFNNQNKTPTLTLEQIKFNTQLLMDFIRVEGLLKERRKDFLH